MNSLTKRIENLERKYGIGADDRPIIVCWKSLNRDKPCKIGDLRQADGEPFDAFLERARKQCRRGARSLWLENVDRADALPNPESSEPRESLIIEAMTGPPHPPSVDEPENSLDELPDKPADGEWWH